MTTEPRSQRRRIAVVTVALGLVVVVAGMAMVSTDVLGTGRLFDRAVAKVDRFMAGPVPDRSAPVLFLVAGVAVMWLGLAVRAWAASLTEALAAP